MSNDLISRKSILDYIENEIATARSKETISYLRALSIHINEFEPTAFDVDKAISNIWDKSELIHIKHEHNDEVEDYIRVTDATEIVRNGGIDERCK